MAPKDEDFLKPIEENLLRNLNAINLEDSKNNVMKKLGGEFDYPRLSEFISDIMSDAKDIWKEYERDTVEYNIHVPDLILD